MVEEQRARVEEAMRKMVDDVDKSYLRGIQGKMFTCAAACCDDKDASVNNVHRCIENCGTSLKYAQSFFQQEVDHLQDRLQRCIMSCNDSVRDKIGPGANESEISRYTGEFEGCANKCVDSYISLIPATLKKMKEFFNKKEFLNH